MVVTSQVQVDISEEWTARGLFARAGVGQEAGVDAAVGGVGAVDRVVDEALRRVELFC